VRVERTCDRASLPHNGFEDRESHRTPCASEADSKARNGGAQEAHSKIRFSAEECGVTAGLSGNNRHGITRTLAAFGSLSTKRGTGSRV